MLLLSLIYSVLGCEKSLKFTECSGDTRAAIIYPIDCNTTEPRIYTDLPCRFICGPGQRLDFDESTRELTCSLCPQGTYSIGGGHEYNTWNMFEEDFHTYCWVLGSSGWDLNSDCTTWHSSSDSLLVTGTSDLNVWYETDFTFYPTLVKDGYIEINYRKEDGNVQGYQIGDFYVFIDEFIRYFDFTSNNPNWKNVKITLSKGIHKVQIVYDKFVSEENCFAKIHSIQVRGSQYAELECKSCELGFSPSGSDKCYYCEVGSYLDQTHSDCKECLPGTISRPGSVGSESCYVPEKCQESGWHYYFSECEAGKQKMVYEWNDPLLCDPLGVSLPEPEVYDCKDCGPGRVYENNQCQYCPSGSFSPSGKFGETCQPCGPGTYASIRADFYEWTKFPEEFIPNCLTKDKTECSYDWELRGTYLTTSPVYYPFSIITLETTFESIEPNSTVAFYYSVIGAKTKLTFYINSHPVLTSVGDTSNGTVFPVNNGENTYKWSCYHSDKQGESCELDWIILTGNTVGGGTKCLPCPSNSISAGGTNQCQVCPTGMTSNDLRTECKDCEKNTFTDIDHQCQHCLPGLSATSNKKSCELLNDTIAIGNSTYILQNLTGTEKQVPFYCTESKLQMFCYESFYGPVQGSTHYFYLSVLTSRDVQMPSYSQLFEGHAYAFAVINTTSLKVEQADLNEPGDECEVKDAYVVVNTGRELEAMNKVLVENKTGFEITYKNGDFCQDYKRFRTNIKFLCAKEEEEGWPIYEKFENCTFYFYWPTVHACELCTNATSKVHNGKCRHGKRTVHNFEHEQCIFADRISHSEYTEDCDNSRVFRSWPFVVSVGICVALFIFIVVIAVLVAKKRNSIARLTEFKISGNEIEMGKAKNLG